MRRGAAPTGSGPAVFRKSPRTFSKDCKHAVTFAPRFGAKVLALLAGRPYGKVPEARDPIRGGPLAPSSSPASGMGGSDAAALFDSLGLLPVGAALFFAFIERRRGERRSSWTFAVPGRGIFLRCSRSHPPAATESLSRCRSRPGSCRWIECSCPQG